MGTTTPSLTSLRWPRRLPFSLATTSTGSTVVAAGRQCQPGPLPGGASARIVARLIAVCTDLARAPLPTMKLAGHPRSPLVVRQLLAAPLIGPRSNWTSYQPDRLQ